MAAATDYRSLGDDHEGADASSFLQEEARIEKEEAQYRWCKAALWFIFSAIPASLIVYLLFTLEPGCFQSDATTCGWECRPIDGSSECEWCSTDWLAHICVRPAHAATSSFVTLNTERARLRQILSGKSGQGCNAATCGACVGVDKCPITPGIHYSTLLTLLAVICGFLLIAMACMCYCIVHPVSSESRSREASDFLMNARIDAYIRSAIDAQDAVKGRKPVMDDEFTLFKHPESSHASSHSGMIAEGEFASQGKPRVRSIDVENSRGSAGVYNGIADGEIAFRGGNLESSSRVARRNTGGAKRQEATLTPQEYVERQFKEWGYSDNADFW